MDTIYYKVEYNIIKEKIDIKKIPAERIFIGCDYGREIVIENEKKKFSTNLQ